MPKMYRKSGNDVRQLMDHILAKYYPHLLAENIRVDLMDAFDSAGGPAVMHNGLPALAVIRVVKLKDRVKGMGDVEITFDSARYDNLTQRQKMSLIDHELYHLEIKRNKDGEPKRDDIGRTEYKLQPHDREFGWFDAVASRWGEDSHESIQAREMVNDEDFMALYVYCGQEESSPAVADEQPKLLEFSAGAEQVEEPASPPPVEEEIRVEVEVPAEMQEPEEVQEGTTPQQDAMADEIAQFLGET